MNDYQPHEMYCPNCSAPSPAGGLCASCLAIPEPAIDANTWIREILAEDPSMYHPDNVPPDTYDSWSVPENEPVCPNCSGPSPTGGYCASCLAILLDEAREEHPSTAAASTAPPVSQATKARKPKRR